MAILSLKRKWIKVNQKLCDMLGYTEKEMLSMTYDDIADPIHKKENEETYRKFEKRMIGSYISERIFVKKDKTNVWVNITMSLIEDNGGAPIYYISQIEDITEKKKGLKELSDYKIALDESSIVAITDPKCIINYVNDNYCKIAGHKCEDLVGKGYSIINSDCNPPDHLKELLATISKGKIWHGDLCDIAKDGTIYWIENTIVPFLNDKGKPWQYVAIGSNITDRINAEHQREKMLEDIVQRNKDLEQFAYIVSHNLRSPLANIMGFTEELKQKTNTEEQNQLFLDYLAVSVNKLDTVINDLNNILQVKHQVNELKETISLTQVLQDTETMLSNIIDSQDIKIKSDFSAIDEIKTIKSYLYSIFYNLITNSIKYRRSTVKSTIHIKSKTLPGFIILTFKDNGMGIDMAKQGENLFGLYKRFHTTVAEGKGVGLYITKTQIESIGGKIKVTSKVNSGTEFSIQLPL
ncbi:MAG: PAS domain S-box protein [Sphingobacteriales bacterium JAD_PAG50586_3]|nr:MAG: PAS domain S-box protein [Sphingobacteriales bacterium JAD_PAG50586_3]